jgi:serine/threonine protein phosphatase PrpC
LDFGCHQDQGSRGEQQDFFGISNPDMDEVMSDRGVVAVVADGMGGHEGGAQASYLAVQSFMKAYAAKRYTQTIPEALNEALLTANRQVYKENCRLGEDSDMGTTLLATVIQGMNLYWVSAGDSRLYFVRNGRIEAVNKEHSYGAELDEKVRNGQLTIDQVQLESGRRHMLTSYLGLKVVPKINASVEAFDLDPGDKILLCSDGLYNALAPHEIQAELESDGPTQDKCERLIQRALDKNRPRQDNITAVVLELAQDPIVYAMPEQAAPKAARSWKYWTLVALLALLGVAVGYLGFGMLFGGDDPVQAPPPAAEEKTDSANQAEGSSVSGETGAAPGEQQTTTPKGDESKDTTKDATKEDSSSLVEPSRSEMKRYQQVFKSQGFYLGAVDGVDGSQTRKALKAYQENNGLEDTGEFDATTVVQLERDSRLAERQAAQAKAEAEKQAELERERAEAEKQAELERERAEAEKQAELERERAEAERQAELERERANKAEGALQGAADDTTQDGAADTTAASEQSLMKTATKVRLGGGAGVE